MLASVIVVIPRLGYREAFPMMSATCLVMPDLTLCFNLFAAAKMVGNTVGVTLDGGDGPILLFSGVGFIATVAFGVWATNDFPGL
jgi:hypothetical protein